MTSIKRLAPAVCIVLCTACTTPQIALDHANNGAQLTQHLQSELLRYKEASKLASERRIAAVQEQQENALRNARTRAFDDYLDTTANRNTAWMASARRLQEAQGKYASLLSDEEKAQKELAERLAAVTKDLPTPGEKLGAVQKALADLGTELSPSERFAIVQKFLAESKAIVDKNAQAAADAASAPAADAKP